MPVTGTDRRLLRSGTPGVAAVLLLGLCLAAGGAWWWQNDVDRDAEVQFKRSVERVVADVALRFRQPVYGLNGARGLYAASQHVQRAEFLAYVESRDLAKEFPGVRGFGFIQHVMRQELDAFVAAERADGAPGFAIRQLADKNHDDLYVIKFIEPAASNAGTQGLDIGSEANRRAAARRAIDTGEPTITAAITLVQDQRKNPGVLLFVPVYANGSHPSTADERRAALVGLLYAPIVIAELLDGMADVGAGRIDFELFDTAPGAPGGTLLYDADHHLANPSATQDVVKGRRFSISSPLSLSVGDLTLQASSSAGFDAAIDHSSKWLVFVAGALLSALLALLLRQQATGRRRAEVLAQQMTEQLRQDQERSRDFASCGSDWFWETDAEHRFCYFSDNFEAVYGMVKAQWLGRSRKELMNLNALNPPAPIAAHQAQLDAHLPFKNFEYRTRNKAGEITWFMTSGLPHVDAHGRFAGYRGTGTIITERMQMLESLQKSEARHRALFEHSTIPMLLIDPKDGAIVRCNQAAERFYGYGRDRLRSMLISEINQLPPDEILAEMALAKSEQRDCFYFPHRLANGEIREVEVRSGPIEIDGRELLYSVINDVTERRAAEMALVTETARLQALLETATDGIHILDLNGKLIQCSHSFATMLGYTDAEISGFNVADWDAQISKERLADAVRGLIKAPARFETRHRCKDGTLIDVEIHAKAVEISGETFLYNSSRDITERKRHEEALASQSARLSNILEGTHVGTWEWNVRTGATVFNERWAEIIGYTLDELAPVSIETWMKLAHPDDLNLSGELLERHFAGELDYYECESRMRHKDGRWVWVLDRGKVASRTAEGKPLMMFGTHMDITERKQTEQRLDRLLVEQKALLENELIGIVTVKDRVIVWANPAFEKMLGYAHGELAGKATRNNYPSEEAYLAFGAAAYPVLAAGKIFRSQFEHVRKDGSRVWLDVSGAFLDREAGETLWGFVDISQHARTVAELKRSNAELEQFSYSISHDMRQPLRMVSSYMQLLEKSLTDQLYGEQRGYFDFAIDGARRMDGMMLGLLDYSRVGRKGEPPAWIESRALLDEALLFLQPAIAEAQADIRIEGVWPKVLVSPDEMLRLIQNLIGNALKFRVAGRTPEITLTSGSVGGTSALQVWRVSVTDNGIGIVPNQIDRLFQVFQRLQSRADFEGTGIGLALCRKIAEHHGGKIWAESAGEGLGSTFKLSLPMTLPATEKSDE